MCDKIWSLTFYGKMSRMTDFTKAKKQFHTYLKDYDSNNSKIALKNRHTMGVVEISELISRELELSEEDVNLAMLIALLHDIGRFEQAIKFNSFEDYESMDHGQLAVKILFKDGLISEFIDTREFDNIISKAILNHNKLDIENGLTKRELLHAKLIRDADKTDNFRVRAEGNFEDIFDSTLEGLERSKITNKIYDDFMSCRMIISTERKTPVDFWVSYLAYIFDFNFPPGMEYIMEKDYINIIIDRIDYKVPETIRRMENIRKHAIHFINESLKNAK
jgi:putative nucleotidyltransferase with HDIG domain